MLRHDVIDAVAAGHFSIYPLETADQAIELLTGVSAGEMDDQGSFPEGSVNRLIGDRLSKLAAIRRSYGRSEDEGKQTASADDPAGQDKS
ncbi:hypothetical protein [Crenobacter oryzisoli]|nr:hypothetical protein [Crenobacter sp. SG2303]